MRTKHKTVLLHKSVYTEQPKKVDEWLLEAENRGLVAKVTEGWMDICHNSDVTVHSSEKWNCIF